MHENRFRITFPRFLIGIVVAFAVGGGAMQWFDHQTLLHFFSNVNPIRNAIPGYEYSVPLLGINSPPATDVGFFVTAKTQIETAAAKAISDGSLSSYGVYMRDLNTPFWFGINEDRVFLPASLYKLPIALVVYKELEDGVLSKNTLITYYSGVHDNPLVATSTLTSGASYSVETLVDSMLRYSDNGAKDALGSVLQNSYVSNLWKLVNLGNPHPDEEISVRDYSFFLRLLYSSTYLSVDDSEKVLRTLASSSYSSGLVAGIPRSVKIAHKWGLYNLTDKGKAGVIELHDCGIIYRTNAPYLLCVMTEGHTEASLESFIAQVSKIVYDNRIDQ